MFVCAYVENWYISRKILPYSILTNYIRCIGIKLCTVIFNRIIGFQIRIEYGTACHNMSPRVLLFKTTYKTFGYTSVLRILIMNEVFVMKWNLTRKRFHEHPIFFFKNTKMLLLLTVTVISKRKYSHLNFLCRKIFFCTSFYGPDVKTRCYTTCC